MRYRESLRPWDWLEGLDMLWVRFAFLLRRSRRVQALAVLTVLAIVGLVAVAVTALVGAGWVRSRRPVDGLPAVAPTT